MKTGLRFLSILLMPMTIVAVIAVAPNAAQQQNPATVKQERRVELETIVAVRNNFGKIEITGWERDTVEASATNTMNNNSVPVKIAESLSVGKKFLIVSVAANRQRENGKISLRVKVPRSVKLEAIQAFDDSVLISDLENFVEVNSESGDIVVKNVKGAVNVKTQDGDMTLENIGGRVEATTGVGIVLARNVSGDVRLISIGSRKIDIRCVAGRVEINDTSSLIALSGIRGDVDVATSTGVVRFTGEVLARKRYRLKTLTGVVAMTIPDSAGFTVTLQTYEGAIRSAFDLQNDPAAPNRRLTGKFGDGQAEIEMDAFSGNVQLKKVVSSAVEKCEN